MSGDVDFLIFTIIPILLIVLFFVSIAFFIRTFMRNQAEKVQQLKQINENLEKILEKLEK